MVISMIKLSKFFRDVNYVLATFRYTFPYTFHPEINVYLIIKLISANQYISLYNAERWGYVGRNI